MKLDKITFAILIGYCANRGMTIDNTDVRVMDDLINIAVPDPINNEVAINQSRVANEKQVNEMFRLAVTGHKIDAIKLYRSIFTVGLKEAKDAIEGNG